MKSYTIRPVVPEDAAVLRAIYAPYVEKTAISFEYDVPSEAEFRTRITATVERYPYFAAEIDGVLCGYAYASAFHPRKAYEQSVELSIYLREDCRRAGLGTALYAELERQLNRQNVTNLYACIAAPIAPDDPYLTDASIRFHERLGFKLVGTFHSCGKKFKRWYDMVWMEKIIACELAGAFIPRNELDAGAQQR